MGRIPITDPLKNFHPIPSQYPVIAPPPFHPFTSLLFSVLPLNLASHGAERKITKIVAKVIHNLGLVNKDDHI